METDPDDDVKRFYALILALWPDGLTWSELSEDMKKRWREFERAAATHFLTGIYRDWKPELRKYGRHALSCPTSAPCTCGFAAIERELNT